MNKLIVAVLALNVLGCATETTSTPPPSESNLCTNTCQWAFDNECDDGGPGSLYSICAFGTDCGDCGPRTGTAPPPPNGACANTCQWAFDGECDDGGPGSLYSICSLGSDCADCGPR